MTTKTVSFDKAKLKRLQTAYDGAVGAGANTFEFDGHEYLTRYAFYLIQYLQSKVNVN